MDRGRNSLVHIVSRTHTKLQPYILWPTEGGQSK